MYMINTCEPASVLSNCWTGYLFTPLTHLLYDYKILKFQIATSPFHFIIIKGMYRDTNTSLNILYTLDAC